MRPALSNIETDEDLILMQYYSLDGNLCFIFCKSKKIFPSPIRPHCSAVQHSLLASG